MRKYIILLFILLSVNAFAGSTGDREAEKFGFDYIKKTITICNKELSYLKSAQINDIREYRGSIKISLHEPPSRNPKKTIEWSGSFEINASNERMNFNNEGWTQDLPAPLLFTVEKMQGKWQARGLQKVSCGKIQRLSSK
jgi:hypothetical protein